jgi:hypothetical protein
MLRQINDNVIAVKLPKGYIFSYITELGSLYWTNSDQSIDHVSLPPGKWKILGKLDELTDQDKEMVCPCVKRVWGQSYCDYTKPTEVGYHYVGTLAESFQSFLDANKLYSVNPLGEKPMKTDDYEFDGGSEKYQMEIDEWEESESNTGDWLIILREGEL